MVWQVGDVACQRMDSALGHPIPLRPLPTGKEARPALPPRPHLPKRWPLLTSLKPRPAPMAGQSTRVGTGQFLQQIQPHGAPTARDSFSNVFDQGNFQLEN